MKIKILANDGISRAGIDLLEKNNYEVITENVNQDDLVDYINNNNISITNYSYYFHASSHRINVLGKYRCNFSN